MSLDETKVCRKRKLAELSQRELERYSRHLILPEIGQDGQKKLKAAKVLLVGAGGLGSPSAMYLAAAGVGNLGLIDDDVVEENNLQRQIIHSVSALGKPKTDSARARILDINPYIAVRVFNVRLSGSNAYNLFSGYDIVIDCSDNYHTRYLINDACVLLGKPLVYGAVHRFEGQVTVFDTSRGGCLRCLFSEPPDIEFLKANGEGGIFGVLPGIIGSIQANEVIKLILDSGAPLINRLLTVDSWRMRFYEIKLKKNRTCPLCGDARTITGLIPNCNP